jgi:hypothetical protein
MRNQRNILWWAVLAILLVAALWFVPHLRRDSAGSRRRQCGDSILPGLEVWPKSPRELVA